MKDLEDIIDEHRPLIIIDGDFVKIVKKDVWVWLDWLETEEGLLSYIYNMAGKHWVTPKIIREFTRVVCEYRNWKIYDIEMQKGFPDGAEYWNGKEK